MENKMFSGTPGMRQVTQDEWADFVSDYTTYQTESIFPNYSIMYSRLRGFTRSNAPGPVIAEVHYAITGEKAYFIKEQG